MACHKKVYQWQSVQETIDDLVGKISVKKRDNESIFRQQQETIKRNEERIGQLRLAVKEAHQDLAKMLNMDYNVIQGALESEKDKKLECKRYDAHTALKELNEDVCVEGKRLNHFVHQKECRLRRLQDLRLHYRDFMLLEESNFERPDKQRVRLLMTKLDKMIMKRNTAAFLKATYGKTSAKLETDYMTMHKHLDGLEANISVSKAELTDLSKIYCFAKKGKEQSRSKRMSLEQDVYNSKQGRDATIIETRKLAKEAADLADFGQITRAPNDILGGSGKVKKSNITSTAAQLECLVPIIEQFSAVTNTVTAAEIPRAYERQIEHFDNMSKYSVSLDAKLTEKRQGLSETSQRLMNARYQRNEEMQKLDNELETLIMKQSEIANKTEQRREDQTRLNKAVENVRHALLAITDRLIPARIKGEKYDTTTITGIDTSLDEQVDIIRNKLDSMRGVIQEAVKRFAEENNDNEDEVTIDQVKDTLLKLKSKYVEGVRITVTNEEDESTSDNFVLDDINLNEFYITRDEIKKYGSGAQKLKLKGMKRAS